MRSWSRLATSSSAPVTSSTSAPTVSSRCGSPPGRSGSSDASNSRTSSRVTGTYVASDCSRYSWLNVDPACRRYLA